MTDHRAQQPAKVEPPEEEELYGVSGEELRRVREALEGNRLAEIEAIAEELHAADLADLIERLDGDERRLFVGIVRHILDPETLAYLDETVREEVMEILGPTEVAQAITELDSDDAVELLEDLSEEDKERILASLPPAERALLVEGLTFPEESAGRLMQREMATVPTSWTVGETIDYMRAAGNLPDDFYDLFVVDPKHKPVGSVPLSRVLRSRRPIRITDIMDTEIDTIPVDTDREEVASLFRQYGLVSAPVVDQHGRLIGVITVDDVVDVIDEEAEEDLLAMARVGESDFHAPAHQTAPRRIKWLLVTLVNTVLAAGVISRFEATIEQLVALAVLMPIVAAMGGNTGMQVVTVAVRALATRDLSRANAARVLGKELGVALMNSLVFALIMGAVAWAWFGRWDLALVLSGAMIFNMVWAGFAGVAIPLTLETLGVDPAVAAGPFLTTTTDVLGFFVFLGLATLFLL
ncbi:MAG TPA: magnesium transporter [Alphaproteobacteria bacterium]|nr:magnesium transporter [Alphaproteobacteria bacterium]